MMRCPYGVWHFYLYLSQPQQDGVVIVKLICQHLCISVAARPADNIIMSNSVTVLILKWQIIDLNCLILKMSVSRLSLDPGISVTSAIDLLCLKPEKLVGPSPTYCATISD